MTAKEKHVWDDWDEDTPAVVLKRYLATFGEPEPIPRPPTYRHPDTRTRGWHYEDFDPDRLGSGQPHVAPDPRRPRWVTCPKEPSERALERLHLGLSCPIAAIDHQHGRRAPSDPYRPPREDE